MTRSVIQIRLTPEQRIQLDDDRGETPLSEYVRERLGLTSAPARPSPSGNDGTAEASAPKGSASPPPEADREPSEDLEAEIERLAKKIHYGEGATMHSARKTARLRLEARTS